MSAVVALAGGRLDVHGGRNRGGTVGLFALRAQASLTDFVIDGAVTGGIDASDTSPSLDGVAVRGSDGSFGNYVVLGVHLARHGAPFAHVLAGRPPRMQRRSSACPTGCFPAPRPHRSRPVSSSRARIVRPRRRARMPRSRR